MLENDSVENIRVGLHYVNFFKNDEVTRDKKFTSCSRHVVGHCKPYVMPCPPVPFFAMRAFCEKRSYIG